MTRSFDDEHFIDISDGRLATTKDFLQEDELLWCAYDDAPKVIGRGADAVAQHFQPKSTSCKKCETRQKGKCKYREPM